MKPRTRWEAVCTVNDLVPESGVAVWTDEGPVAVFYLPHRLPALFAISHTDPFSGANVLARGITGDLKGEPVVALNNAGGSRRVVWEVFVEGKRCLSEASCFSPEERPPMARNGATPRSDLPRTAQPPPLAPAQNEDGQ